MFVIFFIDVMSRNTIKKEIIYILCAHFMVFDLVSSIAQSTHITAI